MSLRNLTRTLLLIVIASFGLQAACGAGEVLVADRLSNAVDRYSDTGTFLGTLVTNDPSNPLPTDLNGPDGIVVSPDHTKLFVANSQANNVVEYDYNYAAGTVSNPTVFATAAAALSFPSSMAFSPDGSTLYVANLNGTGITELNASTGAYLGSLGGGSSFAFSGLAFHGSTLLAGGFDGGTVAQSNAGFTAMSDLVPPNATIPGAAGVFVNGNDLYVTGLFGQSLEKFNATTGAQDNTFNVSGLAFPQGIMASPDGLGMLVGVLGFSNGTGNISEYSFSGQFLGVFASAGTGGFTEATAFTHVPEPGSVVLAGIAVAMLGLMARRRAVK